MGVDCHYRSSGGAELIYHLGGKSFQTNFNPNATDKNILQYVGNYNGNQYLKTLI
jgi:hypothetical protein